MLVGSQSVSYDGEIGSRRFFFLLSVARPPLSNRCWSCRTGRGLTPLSTRCSYRSGCQARYWISPLLAVWIPYAKVRWSRQIRRGGISASTSMRATRVHFRSPRHIRSISFANIYSATQPTSSRLHPLLKLIPVSHGHVRPNEGFMHH